MAGTFKLDQPLTITRGSNGRFQEFERDVPSNPLDAAATGQQPQAWAPGVGTGTAPVRGPAVVWPTVTKPAPFKVGG